MAETKPKSATSLRTPKPKKLGLSVPPALRLPHDALISPQGDAPTPAEAPTLPSQTSSSSQTRQTSPPETASPVAPARDFSRVANSITREAIPAGIFKGKSKQLYDTLYAMTRGAVLPVRSIRVSRPKLMKRAGIGARITFDANIAHLQQAGLVSVRQIAGEHEGNEYIVFLPEEAAAAMTSQTSQTSLTSPAQKLDRLVRLETSQTRHTLSVENEEGSGKPKTSFKTNTERIDDDEAFGRLRAAATEITGREAADQQWAELADVLVTELKIAAGRTTVSSAPAFLAEHLRRRLWKKDKRQMAEEGKADVAPPATGVDAARCPDCFGTGMWYPEGFEKGVARCRHERLTGEPGR